MRARCVALISALGLCLALPALAGFAGTDLFIPMAGRGAGAYPSNWFTTVYLYNPNPTAVTVDLSFLERNKDNLATAPPKVTETLAAGETRVYDNIVETTFGRSAYGAVRIQCASKVVASARVFSKETADAPLTQSFGQDFAATPASFAIGLGESTDILGGYSTLPYQDSAARFNIGCVETTGLGSATVRWIARDAAGQEQKRYDRSVLRLSQTQGFFHDYFSGVDLVNARVSASVVAGAGKVICYGSLVTNDKEMPKPVQDPTTFEMAYPDRVLAENAAPQITAVTAGGGLTGGGTAGTVTLDVGAGAGIAVTGDEVAIAPGGVSNAMLADNAVGSAKIAYGAVANSHLAGGAVTTETIADGNVTAADIAAGAVGKPALAAAGGTAGQVLGTDGTALRWQEDGLTLPLAAAAASESALLALENTGAGPVILSQTPVGSAVGIVSQAGSGSTLGALEGAVHGDAGGYRTGVTGSSQYGTGVKGWSRAGYGVHGHTVGGGYAVLGVGENTSTGVRGESSFGRGVDGQSPAGDGVFGSTTSGTAIHGLAASGRAGYFEGPVELTGNLTCPGCVHETDLAANAVTQARLSPTSGAAAGKVLGTNGSQLQWQDDGVSLPLARSLALGDPLVNLANTGTGPVLRAEVPSGSSVAVLGRKGTGSPIAAASGAVVGDSDGIGAGVAGYAADGYGVLGWSQNGNAVFGHTRGTAKRGVWGSAENDSTGVMGESPSGIGVRGVSTTSDGVFGSTSSGNAVHGFASSGRAGFFEGPVELTGNLTCPGCVHESDIAANAVTQSRLSPISGAAAGKVLGTTGTQLQWQNDGLVLPFSGSASVAGGQALFVINTGNGYGIAGETLSGSYAGVVGTGETGVLGMGDGTGVWGSGVTGVKGATSTAGGNGVHGSVSAASGHGVLAESSGSGINGAALYADATGGSGIAIWGDSSSTDTLMGGTNAGTGDLLKLFIGGGQLRLRVENDGDVFADGRYYCGQASTCFNTGTGADIAERVDATGALEPGDVVEIDPEAPGRFRRSSRPASTAVAGVVSTLPAMTMSNNDLADNDSGERTDDRPLLALVGRVPVKASVENGAIKPGDLLVSASLPGHAMRAGGDPAAGTVLGKSLGALAVGTGQVEMLVMLR